MNPSKESQTPEITKNVPKNLHSESVSASVLPDEKPKTSEANANEPENTIPTETISISVLPDDCLLSIFDHIGFMEDLEAMRSVCVRWKELVEIKLKGISNVICYEDDEEDFLPLTHQIARKTVNIKMEYIENKNLKKYRRIPFHLMPNLQMIDFSYIGDSKFNLRNSERLVARFLEPVIRSPEKITGLCLPAGAERLVKYFKNLTIYSVDGLDPKNSNCIKKAKLKKLYSASPLEEIPFIKEYTNLELLKTWIFNYNRYSNLQRKHEAIFTKLETLILDIVYSIMDDGYGDETFPFDLVDICPALKNVLLGTSWFDFKKLNFSKRNLSVQTLVLNFSPHSRCADNQILNKIWTELIEMLDCHPNIKHLAIRSTYNLRISRPQLSQFLELLPNLLLLKLTYGKATSLLKVIDEFNSQTGRSLKFTGSDEMDLACTGFMDNDFMRKFFFISSYKDLSIFSSIIG